MRNFSTNQVRHLYVVKNVVTSLANVKNVGDIYVDSTNDKKSLWFHYMGPSGALRSDLIDVDKILTYKATYADDMAHPCKKYKVTLDSTINSGNPVVGQDYILRLAFSQYIGMSDNDLYFKYGAVHTVKGDLAKDFYKKLALSLVKNFSREPGKMVNIYLGTASGDGDPLTVYTKASDLTGNYTYVAIEEAEQEWFRGTKSYEPVQFTVTPTTITVDGEEVDWGTAEQVEATKTIGNGYDIADLEYFCMGERGDIYRNVGWPNVVPTKYLVDETKTYDTIDIHYYWTGSGESSQKSEKDITFVMDSTSHTIQNNLVNAIDAAKENHSQPA